MNETPNAVLIVLAAGAGARLQSPVPKGFIEVAGKTLLAHAVRRGVSAPTISQLIAVVPEGYLELANRIIHDALDGVRRVQYTVVAGGKTRSESVAAGIGALESRIEQWVLVHDTARAFAPPALFHAVLDALRNGTDAAIPALPVVDTVKEVESADGEERVILTVDRAHLRGVQTPQGFRRDSLEAAHAERVEATDDAALIEARGGKVVCVPGSAEAFKITTPFDLMVAHSFARWPIT